VSALAVGLMLIAFGLLLADVFVTQHGLLALAGIVSLVLADMILAGSPIVGRPAFGMLLAWVGATVLVAVFLVARVVLSHRDTPQTGDDALVGEEAVADQDFALVGCRYEGLVRTRGELWKAVSRAPVVRGGHLAIEARQGLVLTVCAVNALASTRATS
jgi:membrane-bound serine protease (ClpP class)